MTNAGLSSSGETASGSVLAELIEQITEDVESGTPVDVEAYAREHPEHAEQLRRLVPALLALHEVDPSAVESSRPEPEEPATRPEVHGVLGDFRIIEEIGRGGMGVVYKAEQISLRRVIALKVLPFAAMLDSRQLQRFENEARAAACLHHTNIVPVHSVGCERGVHYYAMQYIEGYTLADLIRHLRRQAGLDPQAPSRGPDLKIRTSEQPASQISEMVETRSLAVPLPHEANGRGSDLKIRASEGPDFQIRSTLASTPKHPDTGPFASLSTAHSRKGPAWYRSVAELGIQVAEALDYAHSVGVVHRDIKPANLLLDARGQVWVTDFGLAQIEVDAGMTMSGEVLGTLRYMSPEQALGHRGVLDHRTDIYSLGITLYELLTLRPAFPEENRVKLVQQVAHTDPASIRKFDASIPPDLEAIVLKATAKEAHSRYHSARELAEDLRRQLAHQPIKAKRPSLSEQVLKWVRRHPSLVASTTAILFLIAIGSIIGFLLVNREKNAKQTALETAKQQQAKAENSQKKTLAAIETMVQLQLPNYTEQSAELRELKRAIHAKAAEQHKQFLQESETDPAHRLQNARACVKIASLLAAGEPYDSRFGRSKPDSVKTLQYRNTEAGVYVRKAVDFLSELVRESPNSVELQCELAGAWKVYGDVTGGTGSPSGYERAAEVWERLMEQFPTNRDYAMQCYDCLKTMLSYTERSEVHLPRLERIINLMNRAVRANPSDADCRFALAWGTKALALCIEIGADCQCQSETQRIAAERKKTASSDAGNSPDPFQSARTTRTKAFQRAETALKESVEILDELWKEDRTSSKHLIALTMAKLELATRVWRRGERQLAQGLFKDLCELHRQWPTNPEMTNWISKEGATVGEAIVEAGLYKEGLEVLDRTTPDIRRVIDQPVRSRNPSGSVTRESRAKSSRSM